MTKSMSDRVVYSAPSLMNVSSESMSHTHRRLTIRTLFAVIAIHAAFNTVAMLAVEPFPALVVGAAMIAACAFLPRLAGAHPSPLPA
mgnify:CR=1 FL=1